MELRYDHGMRKLIKIPVLALISVSMLAGCAFSDPRIEATPPVGPSVSDDYAQVADDVHTAWAAIVGLATASSDQRYTDMSETLASQWYVLVGPDPLHRIPAAGATLGDPSPNSGDETTTADTALASARDKALSQATSSTGLETAFWAGLAAGIEQVRLGLTGSYAPATMPDPTVTITIMDEKTSLSNLVSRYDEGIFALRSAMGFLDPYDAAQSTFRNVLACLQTDLATLTEMSVSAGATPTPPGIYELPPGRDHDAAMALLARTQKSLTEASLVWAASADDPAQAVPYVMSNATLAMGYGLGTAAWPGWPDLL